MKNNIISTRAQKKRVEKEIKKGSLHKEKIWTWFIAKILDRSQYNNRVFDYLFNKTIDNIDSFKIGFEVQPIPPRKGAKGKSEGNTHLDLAFGHLEKRTKTESGIKYLKTKNSKVCFIEAKFLSDLSTGISHDKSRNQLTRVVENLLCFQDDNENFPDDICFTLLTPRVFQLEPKAKLYGYKYLEFFEDIQRGGGLIKSEINKLLIPKRVKVNWKYPDITERLEMLRFNWATYEHIFEIELNSNISLDVLDRKRTKALLSKLSKIYNP